MAAATAIAERALPQSSPFPPSAPNIPSETPSPAWLSHAVRRPTDQMMDVPQPQPGCTGGFRTRIRFKHIVLALTQRRHRVSVAWLEEQLIGGDPSRSIVVTHHAPHPASIPAGYAGDPLTPAYASNLEHLMGHAILWVHGHTHDSFDYDVKGTRVVCKPRGYAFGQPARGENDDFSPTCRSRLAIAPAQLRARHEECAHKSDRYGVGGTSSAERTGRAGAWTSHRAWMQPGRVADTLLRKRAQIGGGNRGEKCHGPAPRSVDWPVGNTEQSCSADFYAEVTHCPPTLSRFNRRQHLVL